MHTSESDARLAARAHAPQERVVRVRNDRRGVERIEPSVLALPFGGEEFGLPCIRVTASSYECPLLGMKSVPTVGTGKQIDACWQALSTNYLRPLRRFQRSLRCQTIEVISNHSHQPQQRSKARWKEGSTTEHPTKRTVIDQQ